MSIRIKKIFSEKDLVQNFTINFVFSSIYNSKTNAD